MATASSTSLLLSQPSLSVHRRRGETLTAIPSPSIRWTKRNGTRFSLHLIKTSSSDDLPKELAEDSKFVPLNDDDSFFGPPALLLVGFARDETPKVREFLKELDGEFLKIIHCTKDMLKLSVWDVMHIQQPDLETVEIAQSLPRLCLLSGLSGEEIMMFIDAFPDSGMEPAVFAALVPNSANKLLEEVIVEIMGDHEMLSAEPAA